MNSALDLTESSLPPEQGMGQKSTHLILSVCCDRSRHLGVHVFLVSRPSAKLLSSNEITEGGSVVVGVETKQFSRLRVSSFDFLYSESRGGSEKDRKKTLSYCQDYVRSTRCKQTTDKP